MSVWSKLGSATPTTGTPAATTSSGRSRVLIGYIVTGDQHQMSKLYFDIGFPDLAVYVLLQFNTKLFALGGLTEC